MEKTQQAEQVDHSFFAHSAAQNSPQPGILPDTSEPVLAVAQVEKVMQHIESKRPLYQTFARSGDFSIRAGKQTAFDHKSATAIIGVEQLARLGIVKEHEVDFSVCHELGHMRELYDDPEGYQKFIDESKREDGLGKVYFRMYNCLMDIYVNHNNANRFPIYREGARFSSEVTGIYKDKLFAKRDWTESPKCVQYVDFLLNAAMGAGDDITLSPEVLHVIEAGLKVRGKQKTYREFVEEYLVPVIGDKGAEWQATATQRKRMIDNFIRPVFERMLEVDKEENKDLQNVEAGPEGDFDPRDFEDALEDAKTKKAEKNMTAEEKAKRERDRQTEKTGQEAGLTPEQVGNFQAMYERLQPVIYELVGMWKKLRTATIFWEQDQEGYYKTGSTLSVDEVVNQWAKIQHVPDEIPVMERTVYKEREDWRPRKFRLRMVPDLSGSMEVDIIKVQELVIALAASLSVLNTESRLEAPDFPSIVCALDLIGFNDKVIPIIENNEEITVQDIMKAFGKLIAMDGTSDHTALERINSSIDQAEIDAIKAGDIIDILVELTDGDTSRPEISRRLVDEIESKGVVVGAIKFGEGVRLDKPSDKPEEDYEKEKEAANRDTFRTIWNEGKPEIRGYRIKKATDLIPTMYQLLKKLIEHSEKTQ